MRFPEKSEDPAVFVIPDRPQTQSPSGLGTGTPVFPTGVPRGPLLLTFEPVEDRSSLSGGGLKDKSNFLLFPPPRK